MDGGELTQNACRFKTGVAGGGGAFGKNVLFLAQRVLFEDFIDHVEDRALPGGFPDAFDVFHFDLKSKDGEVRTERVSLKHGEAEITLTGQGHPNGEIETKVRGREIRLENTNTIANSGFGLSGLLNFEMDLTGPVLAPDALMRAKLTKTAIAEASMPDSAFDLRFARNRIEGSGQLLGDVLAGEFVWPFEADAPLVIKLRANDWNFAPIFAAIAGPASRKDFEAELSGVVDLQAPRGGLWASTGKIDLSRIRLSRGPISIANVDPIRARIRDGVLQRVGGAQRGLALPLAPSLRQERNVLSCVRPLGCVGCSRAILLPALR
jgi:hypothetical protein